MAWHALVRARNSQVQLDSLTGSMKAAQEVARISPAYRRHRDELGSLRSAVEVDRPRDPQQQGLLPAPVLRHQPCRADRRGHREPRPVPRRTADAVDVLSRALSAADAAERRLNLRQARNELAAVATELHPARLHISRLEGGARPAPAPARRGPPGGDGPLARGRLRVPAEPLRGMARRALSVAAGSLKQWPRGLTPPAPAAPTPPSYRCAECGWTTAKWVGRCGECRAWGTVEETGQVVARTTAATAVTTPARRIADVDATLSGFQPTKIDELDRVLGGGLVPGAVILLPVSRASASRPSSSTSRRASPIGKNVLYVTGEESAAQVVAASGPDRRRRRLAVPERGDGPRPGARAGREGRPRTARRRLRADPQQRRGGRQRRRGDPGAGGRGVADLGGEGSGDDHPARGPCHQGRLHRRTEAPRAPRRRRVPVRWRAPLAAAPPCGR